ncbi:retrovirus-related pol polyprotein from transposon TNT 1-94 [Tanacetum coccineum]|uniref:Retrovirus-related pol polyprotein from transposon TNT 1-94 n=1 Tax=Tanacetum coccineum TaxID=301880 RepID=A0ABQ5HEX0_9ASTR
MVMASKTFSSQFHTINLLSKKDIVNGLPKLKYVKDQLCSSCELSKAKQSTFKTKTIPSSKGRLNLLYMDLCGPMRIESINGKKYILMIVDDYSRYTWTLFLRTKDETPEKVLNIKLQLLEHWTQTALSYPKRTLVEAARTMLSASKLPLFFWAEAIATACYTQLRSLIIPRHEKTPYHIINGKKPSLKHLYIFGCTCYITRDGENLDRMKEKGDPCIFVGCSTTSKGYKVIQGEPSIDTLNHFYINFDEIKELSKASDYDNSDSATPLQMTFEHNSSSLGIHDHSNEPSSSTLVPNGSPLADINAPSLQELEFLFSPLFEEYFTAGNQKPITPTINVNAKENNNDQAADAQIDENEFYNIFSTPIHEEAESSSCNVDNLNMHTFYQHHQSEHRWTKDHSLEQVRGNPSKPVQTRRQLATDPEMCMFILTVSTTELKNIKEVMADSAWIEAMQDELHQFDRLQVWELVDKPYGKKVTQNGSVL